jgi:predicted secreted hydrolase
MNKRFTHKAHTWIATVALSLLTLLLTSCGFPGVVSTSARLPQVTGTPQATNLPPIRLPQDEAAHKDLTEWWYYTGHLNATDVHGKARHYGFELVVFQLLRSDFPPVYASHFAISDVTRGEFHYDQRRVIEPNAVIPNGTSTKGINVSVGDRTIQGLNGHDQLAAWMKDYTMQLNLTGLKAPTFHNGNGLITLGLGGFSYYYSRTRMAVAGTLIDHNQALQVTGQAWMDHQWGNFLAPGIGSWDWYSIQLNNKTEMMIYVIRDARGKALTTYLSYIDANDVDHLISASAINATALSHWTSLKTGITYPSGWQLRIKDSQLQATLTLIPQLKDQELVVTQSTGNVYWEGTVNIDGQLGGKNISGEGYVELTGYTR